MVRKTFVTIRVNGQTHTVLVNAKIIAGRAVVSQVVIDQLLDRLGVRRGDTYSIG